MNKNVFYKFIKRSFDVFVSLVALIFLSPILIVVAILIKVTSKGPVFFKHKRVGRNGEQFMILKFRTMKINAEDLIKEFTPEQKKEWEQNFKLENDPRITGIGNFLRKTSIDELPQLYNILCGDMSIVGPRPVIEKELEWYGERKSLLLSVRPGLTGYWASHGRSNVEYPKRCDLELFYVKNCSLWLDIKIILKTFISVLIREGAK